MSTVMSVLAAELCLSFVEGRTPMTAMQKVAWTELLASVVTLIVVTALLPVLGSKASAAFGLLGFLVAGMWFIRKGAIIDERDREIEAHATKMGIGVAWQSLFLALIAIVFWNAEDRTVSTSVLTWLVWLQFAICYGVKGFVAVRMYRSQSRAA